MRYFGKCLGKMLLSHGSFKTFATKNALMRKIYQFNTCFSRIWIEQLQNSNIFISAGKSKSVYNFHRLLMIYNNSFLWSIQISWITLYISHKSCFSPPLQSKLNLFYNLIIWTRTIARLLSCFSCETVTINKAAILAANTINGQQSFKAIFMLVGNSYTHLQAANKSSKYSPRLNFVAPADAYHLNKICANP